MLLFNFKHSIKQVRRIIMAVSGGAGMKKPKKKKGGTQQKPKPKQSAK